MRVLFFLRNLRGYFRMFEPVLRLLAAEGVSVHVAYDDKATPLEQEWIAALQRQHPTVTAGLVPDRRASRWYGFSRSVRVALDYLRFLRPEFDDAPDLRLRAAARAPALIVFLSRLPGLRSQRAIAALTAVMGRMERALPSSRVIETFIKAFDPHAVLITPLLSVGSRQPDYLKSARALGVPTMVCVASWDNLSSKSLIRLVPDTVTVWNETQRREAVELHGVPAERVVVTGAQSFDTWFDWMPRPRQAFLERVGLPADRPFFLYTCSSLFAASITEAEFVGRWVRALRSSGEPGVSAASILIRPHPKRNEEWATADIAGFENVVLWPRTGTMPVADEAKADYFDSMYHSAAVVGLNTSAFIEAGIVGRPVHAVLTPEFAGSQGGTLHFHYLTDVDGGLLRVAATLDEHAQQLGEALAGVNWRATERRRFLQSFVRPLGLDVPAAPRFVEAVLALARGPRPAPLPDTAAEVAWRWLMTPFAVRSQIALKAGKSLSRFRKIARARGVRGILNEYVKINSQSAGVGQQKTKKPGKRRPAPEDHRVS